MSMFQEIDKEPRDWFPLRMYYIGILLLAGTGNPLLFFPLVGFQNLIYFGCQMGQPRAILNLEALSRGGNAKEWCVCAYG